MTNSEFQEELTRAFLLALSIEPLAEKRGCTTRKVDASPGTKLEYFIVSAVNSYPSFAVLINRILDLKKQPECIFDIAYDAQRRSNRNRHGGKVNYAQIFMLIPIITAQCLIFVEGRDPFAVSDVIHRADVVLRQTTGKDVDELQRFVDLSVELSVAHNQRLNKERTQLELRFAGIYSNVHDATKAAVFSERTMAREVSNGYPLSLQALASLTAQPSKGVLVNSETAFENILGMVRRPEAAADCIVVALYLLIVGNISEILFP